MAIFQQKIKISVMDDEEWNVDAIVNVFYIQRDASFSHDFGFEYRTELVPYSIDVLEICDAFTKKPLGVIPTRLKKILEKEAFERPYN